MSHRTLIQFSHLFHSFGIKTLFSDIALSIQSGEGFALIGENGTGKTTLLKILAGHLLPESGLITQSSHLSISYVAQEIRLPSAMTAKAYLEEGTLSALEEQMHSCLEHEQLDKWAELHERYEQLGGYRRIPIEKVLNGLKLESDILELTMGILSSGQKRRLALAKALIENADLLLLDEPTNHLDREMQLWLAAMLKERSGATIIVSHDRKFLNAACNRLLEIKNQKLHRFGGNYDFYLEEKQRRIERMIKAYEAQEKERVLLKQKIKALSSSSTYVKAPKDRNLMAYDHKGGKQQKSLQRRLNHFKDKLAEIENDPLINPAPKNITDLKFHSVPLEASVAIELEEISKSFGKKILFHQLSRKLCPKDRIVITGANGSGKTTLLRCILGLQTVDQGRIYIAPQVKIAYLEQELENMHELSVGQKKRLMLLALIQEKPNVLLLDEPTNHLDLETAEALEKACLDFEGAILAISHDSTFIEKIATEVWQL